MGFNFLLLLVFVLSGCGGGSSSSTTTSSGSVSALTVAEKVSVVDAQSEQSTSSVSPLSVDFERARLAITAVPADSDYNKDKTIIFVEERSAETFNLVNEILCMIAQSQYDDMLNKGDYKAQIDVKQCEQENDSASTAGQQSQNKSSASTMPEYALWTVNSSRADSSSPHIVKAWIHESASGFDPAKVIFTNTVITEGKSDTNPYGIFTMNFKAYPEVNGTVDTSGDPIFKGLLKAERDSATGKVLLKFVVSGGFDTPDGTMSFTEAATLERAADGSTGGGTVSTVNVDSGSTVQTQFDFAFDQNYFLREDALGNKICLDRNSFDEATWRYGLYNSTTGSRVNLNSGFPVRTEDGVHGWVGYYGMWFPMDVSITNGATVYRETYGQGGTATPYQVFIASGRLVKHEKKQLTLADIENIPLQYHDSNPNSGDSTEYRTIWNGTTFSHVGMLNTSTWMWEDITPQDMDLSSLDWTDLHFWSQSLGGSVQIQLEDGTDRCSQNQDGSFDCSGAIDTAAEIANTPVIFYSENLVYPGDTVPSTLSCLENCPNPATINNSTSADDYFDTWSLSWQDVAPANANVVDYEFDTTSMILKCVDTDFGCNSTGDDVVQTASGASTWGVWSGPLFDLTSSSIQNALACVWDDTGTSTCGWQAWSNLDVFYTWETGPNDWNKFTALKDPDTGEFVTFDPPIQVEYTHTQTDTTASDYKYNGTKFYLEYSGFGNLWGIPGVCVDMDTGEETECAEGVRWVPEFSIPDGSTVTDTSTDAEYLVKALEKEQRMRLSNPSDSSDVSACSSLTTTTYTLPSISDWQDPAIGDEPTVTDPPAVIGGVLQ
jgi:hypothetical protein